MTIACAAPDTGLGVALRLSAYVDCQARALGENGFQTLVGGPLAAAALTAAVTLFIALIGYRLIAGGAVAPRDGLGWTFRLGIVLALVTGWPAFQSLAYDVAVDGPGELARVLLPAAGLQPDGLDQRIQAAYDTLRLGGAAPAAVTPTAGRPGDAATAGAAVQPPVAGLGGGQVARPTTALLLVLGTIGLISALRIAIGFLLAIAPVPIVALLFDSTVGLFTGWAATLGGTALAVLGCTMVTAAEMLMVETEIARIQAYSRGMVPGVDDPEALPLLVAFFGLAALIVAVLAMRSTGLLRLRIGRSGATAAQRRGSSAAATGAGRDGRHAPAEAQQRGGPANPISPSRAALIASGLTHTVHRESRAVDVAAPTGTGRLAGANSLSGASTATHRSTLRRTTQRRTRMATSRDRIR